jgi:hypothetical protein
MMCSIKSTPTGRKQGENIQLIFYNTLHQISVSYGGEKQSKNIKINDTLLRKHPTELSINSKK